MFAKQHCNLFIYLFSSFTMKMFALLDLQLPVPSDWNASYKIMKGTKVLEAACTAIPGNHKHEHFWKLKIYVKIFNGRLHFMHK